MEFKQLSIPTYIISVLRFLNIICCFKKFLCGWAGFPDKKELFLVELQTNDLAVITLFLPIEIWSTIPTCPATVT